MGDDVKLIMSDGTETITAIESEDLYLIVNLVKKGYLKGEVRIIGDVFIPLDSLDIDRTFSDLQVGTRDTDPAQLELPRPP